MEASGRTMKFRAVIVALLFFVAVGPSFADDDCALRRVVSLDMGSDPAGRVTVPISIEGKSLTMLVDTGGFVSTLDEKVVQDLDLSTELLPLRFNLEAIGGIRLTSTARAHDVALANLKAPIMSFAVMPAGHFPQGVNGILGPDVLAAYDTEFDFANDKFNLYQQDHCVGKVVYWTHDSYAVVPFWLDPGNHIRIDVTLDGKKFRAMIDTGAYRSIMNLEAAKDVFDIADNDPNLKPAENGRYFSYPFKSLDLQGVSVTNPAFELMPHSVSKVRGLPDIIIGMGILRQLHLYIAYRERNIYATTASAH
jgi:predicted aspartyl protease